MRLDGRTMSNRPDTGTIQAANTNSFATSRKNSVSDNITNTSSLMKGLAGMGSGAISSVVCAPLDLVRTRMQVMGGLDGKQLNNRKGMLCTLKDILAQEGYLGCFRGLGASLATVPIFWGIYFPMYEVMKGHIFEWQEQQDTNGGRQWNNDSLRHMASAIVAGGTADVVCNPMFVVRTRMQTEALHIVELSNAGVRKAKLPQLSISGTISSLYREGGIPIFWRGLTASLMGEIYRYYMP